MNEGLKTLIRLQNWKIDQKRREQGVLEGQRAGYLQLINSLDAEVEREMQLASNMATPPDFGTYTQRVKAQKEELFEKIRDVDAEIEIIADALRDLFQELKRYEISLESRERTAIEDEKRKEQLELDEISMKMHSRKKAGHII